MNYPTFRKYSSNLYPDQRYFITGENEDWQENWNKVINILLDDETFQQLLSEHEVSCIVYPNWEVKFETAWADRPNFGIRYSKLVKAIWDAHYQTFEDYGLHLEDSHPH